MKKLILVLGFCLFATNVFAGQQEDMNLCADRIDGKFNVKVKRSYFDMASECNTEKNGMHFLGFKSQEAFQVRSFGCILNRKENSVIVEEIEPQHLKKYSGLECLGMADVTMAIAMNNVFNEEAIAIDKSIVKKRKAQEQKNEKKQHQDIIEKCKALYSDNEYFEAYKKPKQLSNQVKVIVGWIIGEIKEHNELIFFSQERQYVICKKYPEDRIVAHINKASADDRFKNNQYINVGFQNAWLD